MLIDKTKFDQIYEREVAILATLKEPELHWYAQKGVITILDEVASLLKENSTKPEIKPAVEPKPKAKTKVKEQVIEKVKDDKSN